jgi:small ligand-binding sensory domain FIST
MLLLADPFSVPMNALLPALSRARPAPAAASDARATAKRAPIIGGLASAAAKAGGNVMLFNDTIFRAGGVGVSLRGNIRVDSLVSQGCRAFGPPYVVTGGKGQIITSLGGKPALQALAEAIETLDEQGKKLLQRGIFIGRAITEYKARFGRDDFLIRGVIGVDKNTEALAVAELLRIGQTIQFHLRDAETASEDLGMLLDVQRLYDPPAGALLFTCNGRGTRMFSQPDHDAAAVATAFGSLPLAGFLAQGELGPIGKQNFVHGFTASVGLFLPET